MKTPNEQQLPKKTQTLQKESLTTIPKTTHIRDGKKMLYFTPKKGDAFDTCASKDTRYVCCNVKVLKAVSNCPYECSYCFLQNYLTNTTTMVVKDTDALMEEVYEKLNQQPWRIFRIGTWELGDSLALEEKTGQAKALIPKFATLDNALLELKTKSDCVDTLLSIEHNQRTVMSWSLNTEEIINKEEHKTARLQARLTAIKKVQDAGYLIGLHFDPMIWAPNWKTGYTELIERVSEVIDISQVAWISIGSLRFNPEQKKIIENNYPGSRLTSSEMITGDDGKVRYVKPIRLEMYDHLYSLLKEYNLTQAITYFCMERWDICEKIMGYSPKSIGELDYLFADSLYTRFPQLNFTKPIKEHYEQAQHT